MMYELVVGILLGVIITMLSLYVYWMWHGGNEIVLDDPTDDEDFLEIVNKLKCPECGSDDYKFAEVTDLPWIKGEDRYCICNRCGRQFGDGK